MNNLVRKGLLVGMGLYEKARRKTKKAVKDLVHKNKLSKKEGEKLAGEVIRKSLEMEKKIERHAAKLIAKARVDAARLEKKLKHAARKTLR